MKNSDDKITINDLAASLGISKSTISNYLNGNFKAMSQSTREKIQNEIDRLGYHPSYYARNLKLKKVKTIGVILAHITGADTSAYLNGLYNVFSATQYSVILLNSFDDPDQELRNLEICMEQEVSGIIIRSCCTDISFHETLWKKGIPIVFMDRESPKWRHDAVFIDQRSIVTEALEHMWFNGYRRLFLLSSPFNSLDVKSERVSAFKTFLSMRMPSEFDRDKFIRIIENSPENVSRQISDIMEQYPDDRKGLLVCGNSRLVWQTIYELRAQDISLPENLGLCVFDSEWQWCKLVGSGITAIYQPCEEMARATANLLLLRINGDVVGDAHIQILKARLNVGSTTASKI